MPRTACCAARIGERMRPGRLWTRKARPTQELAPTPEWPPLPLRRAKSQCEAPQAGRPSLATSARYFAQSQGKCVARHRRRGLGKERWCPTMQWQGCKATPGKVGPASGKVGPASDTVAANSNESGTPPDARATGTGYTVLHPVAAQARQVTYGCAESSRILPPARTEIQHGMLHPDKLPSFGRSLLGARDGPLNVPMPAPTPEMAADRTPSKSRCVRRTMGSVPLAFSFCSRVAQAGRRSGAARAPLASLALNSMWGRRVAKCPDWECQPRAEEAPRHGAIALPPGHLAGVGGLRRQEARVQACRAQARCESCNSRLQDRSPVTRHLQERW